MRVSYHTHSCFCDGHGSMSEYVKQAQKLGFYALGFSGHAPIPLPNDWTMRSDVCEKYIKKAYSLKRTYQDAIKLFVGLEIDWLTNLHVHIPSDIEYAIHAVHYAYHAPKKAYTAVDGPPEYVKKAIARVYDHDRRRYVDDYFDALERMLDHRDQGMIAHLDLIKKNNKDGSLFDENATWYKKRIEHVLDRIQAKTVTVEVNTGGLSRGYTDMAYPSDWVIAAMFERGIPICLNSDAHRPAWLDAGYELYEPILKRIGYRTMRIYDNGWKDVPIGP